MRGGATTVRKRRRGLIVAAVGLTLLALAAVALVVAYPRLGVWMIRERAGTKLAAKLGRDVRFGKIEVSFGHATLHDVEIRGELDGDTPLVHADRVDVEFDGWQSLIGRVRIGAVVVDGVVARVQRGADGRDNIRDLVERLRKPGDGDGAADGDGSPSMRPEQIDVHHVRVVANDDLTGTTALVGDGDLAWTPAGVAAHLKEVSATTIAAPRATATAVDITKTPGAAPVVHVTGGEVALWPKFVLSGIAGQIIQNPDAARPGTWVIDAAGGYGGVAQQLWTAKGVVDPTAVAASFDLEAAKFQLDRLAPILEHSAVVDYASTSIDTKVHVDLDRAGAKFAGSFHLKGLNVGHPMIADKEVHDLELAGDIAGSFDRAQRRLELTRGDFNSRNMPFSITGVVTAPPQPPEGDPQAAQLGPHGLRTVSLRLVIPTIDCQRVLEAIPTDMAPYLAGYRLRGVFDADVKMDVDWTNLDATVLDGHVGINQCRVVDEPSDSPRRLKDEFEQYVEVEQGQWISFKVGPSNPDYVPLTDISPYLVKSIMSTEDSAFYFHRGFITSEFKTALVNDLKAGGFRYGASSITMQMVKNVLLYREKTLARKLQELFLTWHVENTLSKDRIMEIYLNVIEYGPGLYGIGPAAWHYFSKPAKDLNPVEAAFFSTILPAPKERYKQYCEGTLTKWTSDKIERILKIELGRNRLTQAEFDTAMATPLVFAKDDSESEEDCLKRVREAIKKARPTAAPPRDAKSPAAPATAPNRRKHKS
nr:biosynthetic peptidoglycan transglycosylase [Kofleriaceae bacterium]